jgi:hypothetical protein
LATANALPKTRANTKTMAARLSIRAAFYRFSDLPPDDLHMYGLGQRSSPTEPGRLWRLSGAS